ATAVAAGATFTLAGAAEMSLFPGRQFTNAGTVNHTAGPLWLTAGDVVVTNQAGGTYNLGDADFGYAFGTVNNAGLFIKSSPSGTGVSAINHVFNNTGTVRVDSGTLALQQTFTDRKSVV